MKGMIQMITVKLFANYREGRGKEVKLDEKEFPTPKDVQAHLDLPEKVGILLVNGFHEDVDYKLQDGDLVSLFPPVAGG